MILENLLSDSTWYAFFYRFCFTFSILQFLAFFAIFFFCSFYLPFLMRNYALYLFPGDGRGGCSFITGPEFVICSVLLNFSFSLLVFVRISRFLVILRRGLPQFVEFVKEWMAFSLSAWQILLVKYSGGRNLII